MRLNFTLHRGSPFVDDVELYEQGIIRIYDVLFPATVLIETDAYIRDFLVRRELEGRSRPPSCTIAWARPAEAFPGCEEHSVVARAALAGVPIYTSSPGDSSIGMNIAYHELLNGSSLMIDPNSDVNEVCAIILAGKRNGCVILGGGRRRISTCRAAHAVGGLRHSQGRQRLLHPDHDRLGGLGRLSGATPAEAVSWGKVNPACCPTPSSPTATRRSRFRSSASMRSARPTAAGRAKSSCTSATSLSQS
jgi:deoxyhypusine synthase